MKHLIATLLCAVASGSAAAQTANVTLYGRINLDLSLPSETGGSYLKDLTPGQGTSKPDYKDVFVALEGRFGTYSLPARFEAGATPVLGRIRDFYAKGPFNAERAQLARDTLVEVGSNGTAPPFVATMYVSSLSSGKQMSATISPPNASEKAFDFRLTNTIRYDSPNLSGLAVSFRDNIDGSNQLIAKQVRITERPQGPDPWTFEVFAEFGFGGPAPRHYRYAQVEIAGGLEGSSAVLGAGFTEGTGGAERLGLYKLSVTSFPPAPPPPPAASFKAAAADDPSRISLDASFGGDGEVIVRSADGTTPLRYWHHAIDAQDRVLVVYGLGRPDGSWIPTLLRLKADGTLDPTFANGGVVVIPTTGLSTNPRTITVDINGNIVVTGETYTATTVRPFIYFHLKTSVPGTPESYEPKLVEHAIPGKENSTFFRHVREPDGRITAVGATFGAYPDVATMRPLLVQMFGPLAALRAIQYLHAGFGHYVTVANPVEIDKLDSGETAGWARTKRSFWVYPLGTPGTAVVDRHFSVSFAKSSHVFAADPAESEAIKKNKDWMFEGPVFGAILPVTGKCPGAMRPVTRIYNNGVTGAPNHQFDDDPDAIAEALARGGVLEGSGPAAAVYCTE